MLLMLAVIVLQVQAQDDSSLIKEGDHLPKFKVQSEKGELNSEDLKGKVVLINFFATWCPPCKKELPHVEEQIWNSFKSHKDFELMIVGREHSVTELKKFKDGKYTMPFYADTDRSAFSLFATQSIPRNYLINREGEVIYASIGFAPVEFEKMIKLLKAELKK